MSRLLAGRAADGSRALRMTTVAAALLLVCGCGHSGGTRTGRAARYADGADPGSSLDLAGARFDQLSGGELELEIDTRGPWVPADVRPSATHALCVWIRDQPSPTAAGRLCAVPRAGVKSGVRLRYTTLDHRGRRTGIRDLHAVVRRAAPTALAARVEPASLSMVPGRYRWQARSRSHGVEDRLPDAREVELQVVLAVAPAARERCFGAAARDPRHRCENPKLRGVVQPTPDQAALSTSSPCVPLRHAGEVKPCGFGVPAVDARATIALVGDSHAAQWRGALEQVARRKRWHGISITRPGCTLSRVTPALEPLSRRRACLRWNAQLPRWLARHPQIHTVFVSEHPATIVAPPGADRDELRTAGHLAAWKALPGSVGRIVVLRDVPFIGFISECVRAARAKHRNVGDACARPRRDVLRPDPAVRAAWRLRSHRARVVDMTPFFCSRRRCLPVIGGALVYKDREHMTEVFATSLGPYLARAIDRLA